MVTEPKSLKFHLRNADVKDIKLEAIEVLGGSGIDIIGISTGEVFSPNEYKEITLVASQIGDIEINTIINFRFDTQIITLYLKGSRAVIFSYRPAYGYSEAKEYKTDIFTAQNGKERRLSKSNTALRKIKFNIKTKEIDSGIESLIAYALKMYCLIPLWFSQSLITKSTTSNHIDCDTSLKEFKTGGLAIVYRDFKSFDFIKLEAVGKDYITANKSLVLTKGDLILPVIKTTPATNINYEFIKGELESWSLEFVELR